MTAPSPCVWMSAGVVGYKLCDRQGNCEDCPFDRALRGGLSPEPHATRPAPARDPRASAAEAERPAGGPPAVEGYRVVRTLFYDARHVWAQIEEEGKVRIGLDDFGQHLLGRVYAVSLPRPGTRVSRNEPGWKVVHGAGETPLAIPVSGTVSEINERLVQEPSLLNRDPYGQGSAMCIVPTRLAEALKRLRYGRDVDGWYRDENEVLRNEVLRATAPEGAAATLPDGGLLVPNLAAVLAAPDFVKIVNFFLKGKRGPRDRGD